jgi:hypothetical protein
MLYLKVMDAVLMTRSVYSFVELSVSPVFRRKWSSIYEALEDGNPPRCELMQLYIQQLPKIEQLVLAGDHTAWPRLEAVTLKERTYEHQAKAFVRGETSNRGTRLQHYSLDSVKHKGVGHYPCYMSGSQVSENPLEKAAAQLRLVCQNLPTRPIIPMGCGIWLCQRMCYTQPTKRTDKLMR